MNVIAKAQLLQLKKEVLHHGASLTDPTALRAHHWEMKCTGRPLDAIDEDKYPELISDLATKMHNKLYEKSHYGRKPKDFTGVEIGSLTCIRPTDFADGRNIIWELECKCGKFAYRNTGQLSTAIKNRSFLRCHKHCEYGTKYTRALDNIPEPTPVPVKERKLQPHEKLNTAEKKWHITARRVQRNQTQELMERVQEQGQEIEELKRQLANT